MRLILNILIYILGLYLIYKVYAVLTLKSKSTYELFKQIADKESEAVVSIKKKKRTKEFLANCKEYTDSLKFLNHSEKRYDELEYITLRKDFVWNGVSIDKYHLSTLLHLSSLLYICFIFILSVFNIRLLVLLLFYGVIPKMLTIKFKSDIKEMDLEINKEFYAFHAVIYHTYKHKANQDIPIPTVMMHHYNSAGEQIKRMIDLFRADYAVAPDKAIDRMKAHYRIDKVYRMCNELLLIYTGREVDLDMLESFQNELKAEHKMDMKRKTAEKKEKSEQILAINRLILLEIIVIWGICLFIYNT